MPFTSEAHDAIHAHGQRIQHLLASGDIEPALESARDFIQKIFKHGMPAELKYPIAHVYMYGLSQITGLATFIFTCLIFMTILISSCVACCGSKPFTTDRRIMLFVTGIMSLVMASMPLFAFTGMTPIALVYTQIVLSCLFILVLIGFGVYWLTRNESDERNGKWILVSVLMALELVVLISYSLIVPGAKRATLWLKTQ